MTHPFILSTDRDLSTCSLEGTIQGQINLRDAIAGTINYHSPEGQVYQLNEQVATLIVCPRGWHLLEKHVLIDGQAVSAGIFDFGLYFFL